MSKKEIVDELSHYLNLYAISKEEKYLAGIITYSGMLVGRLS